MSASGGKADAKKTSKIENVKNTLNVCFWVQSGPKINHWLESADSQKETLEVHHKRHFGT